MEFNKPDNLSVFVNCPYDNGYKPLMCAITFAVFDCGFVAHCADEINNANLGRHQKICDLIRSCRFGIHDISMVKLDKRTRLPRFNMPFELGLFLGISSHPDYEDKKSLIFAHHRHEFSKCLSDLSSREVQVHEGKPRQAIELVRNFLLSHNPASVPGGMLIWEHYNAFSRQLPAACRKLRLDPKNLIFNDYCNLVLRWLALNAPPSKPGPGSER